MHQTSVAAKRFQSLQMSNNHMARTEAPHSVQQVSVLSLWFVKAIGILKQCLLMCILLVETIDRNFQKSHGLLLTCCSV